MTDKFVKLASTFFYVGYFPLAPGTMASLAGGLLALSLSKYPVIYAAVFIAVTFIGFLVSGKMEKLEGKKDPGCVVIDEVSGIMISYFMLPITVPVVVTTFFLFRALDMFKTFPANKLEEMGGGEGIMLDDVLAGIYANIIMQIAVRWAGIV